MDPTLHELLAALGLESRSPLKPLSGGDTAAVYLLDTQHGNVVVKRDGAQRLRGEADGLRALKAAGSALVIPEVLGQQGEWLLLEALETLPGGQANEAALGEGLRQLHREKVTLHGWPCDNACGRTPQPNAPLSDGRDFQCRRRLLPISQACHQRGLLGDTLLGRITAQAEQLKDWLPAASACLVHGDLWSGNVLATPSGPALIDPAVYRHYPEVDLAMLSLFGSPGERFFEAYWQGDESADWPRREALFQLYPLLNHLLLFGASYHDAVEQRVAMLEQFRH